LKKVICTIMILTVFATFTGCKQRYNFSVQYIRANQISSLKEIEYNSVVLVNSLWQLREYYSENCEFFDFTIAHDNIISFDDAIKKYDDVFFEKNTLAVVLLSEGSGSVRHRVASAVKNEDRIDINIRRRSPKVVTDDEAQWHIIIELKKTDVPEDARFSVNVT